MCVNDFSGFLNFSSIGMIYTKLEVFGKYNLSKNVNLDITITFL